MLLFSVGAVLAVAGIIFDMIWLVRAATVVLGIGIVAGFMSRRRQEHASDGEDDAAS